LFKFKEYLVEELPKKIQEEMKNQFQLLPNLLRDSIGTKMVEIVRSCAEDVFQTYPKPMASPPATPPAPAKLDKPRTLGNELPLELVLNKISGTRPDPASTTSSAPFDRGIGMISDKVNNAGPSTGSLAAISNIGGTGFRPDMEGKGKEKLLPSDWEINPPSSGFKDFDFNWSNDDVLEGFLSSLGPLDILNTYPILHPKG
jgi:hypothetical protein